MKISREELIEQGCMEKFIRGGTIYFENEIGEILAKTCTKCQELIKIDGFYKDKKLLGNRKPSCKRCERSYYKDNIEKISLRSRKYREANKDEIAVARQKYYKANTEKIKLRTKKRREDNKEQIAKTKRKYYRDNIQRISFMVRKYREENPEKMTLKNHRRRARKVSLPRTLTVEQQNSTMEYFNFRCALSGSVDCHMDHVIPLVIGHGGTTYGNMIPLRADLNMSKSTRHIFEWFTMAKESHNLSQDNFDILIEYLAQINEMTTQEYRAYIDWCFDNPRTSESLMEEGTKFEQLRDINTVEDNR